MPPAREFGIEHHDLVADGREIARHRQGRGAGADAGDALAVPRRWRAGEKGGDVLFVIGGDLLQPTDRDRLLLELSPTAGRLARTVACASQNPWEHIRFPVDHIGAVIVSRGDFADIFRDGGVRRARPLTVNHPVKVIRVRDVRRLHDFLSFHPFPIYQHVRNHPYASPRTKFLKSGLWDDKRP